MPQMFKNVFGVLALVITVLGALNVYGDFTHVETLARETVKEQGEAFLSQVSRNPISHTYLFVIKGQSSVKVTCARSMILAGEYSCEKE